MKLKFLLFGALALCAAFLIMRPTSAATPVAALADDGPYRDQVIEFPDLTDAARGRRVPIKVHLPAAQVGGPQGFPLVVVSHGAGCSWDANYAQARHLATHGYIVLCVEHIGSNTEVFKRNFRFRQNLQAMTRSRAEMLARPHRYFVRRRSGGAFGTRAMRDCAGASI